jgi:AmmeMemoRadiSam system protein A
MLTKDERRHLLSRARDAIAAAVKAAVSGPRAFPGEAAVIPGQLDGICAGAFVTLKVGGELRGCIGYPGSDRLLVSVVERCAVSAALADPRFRAVGPTEYPSLEIEVSVLGPIEPVVDIDDIEIGRHGLMVELGHRRGLLLPQVAVEWNWERTEFAGHVCVKAGLARTAWKEGALLLKFEAEVFGDGTTPADP